MDHARNQVRASHKGRRSAADTERVSTQRATRPLECSRQDFSALLGDAVGSGHQCNDNGLTLLVAEPLAVQSGRGDLAQARMNQDL